MIVSVFDRVENIMEKGENAGFQHFLLSHKVFKSLKGFLKEVVKSCECVLNGYAPFRKSKTFFYLSD